MPSSTSEPASRRDPTYPVIPHMVAILWWICDWSILVYTLSMPRTHSAMKAARQNRIRRERRLPNRTLMKTMMRKTVEAVTAGKIEEAQRILPLAMKSIDMAAKKHIIHPRNAARKKSRLSRCVHAYLGA